MSEQITKTNQEFKEVLSECKALFYKKLHDYGASWRILRPSSLTDQLFIKAKRIRSIEITNENHVGESVRGEFYSPYQLWNNWLDTTNTPICRYSGYFSRRSNKALRTIRKSYYELMLKKNHDYGEAWRDMRISSYTDFILTKIERVKEIENIKGATLVSEGIDANYMDIIIYAVFGAIKLRDE